MHNFINIIVALQNDAAHIVYLLVRHHSRILNLLQLLTCQITIQVMQQFIF